MTTLTINISDNKKQSFTDLVQKAGGKVISAEHEVAEARNIEPAEEDDVTHEAFFDENIRPAIKVLTGN